MRVSSDPGLRLAYRVPVRVLAAALLVLAAALLWPAHAERAQDGAVLLHYTAQVLLDDVSTGAPSSQPAPQGTPVLAVAVRSSHDTTVCGISSVSDAAGTVLLDVLDVPGCRVPVSSFQEFPAQCDEWLIVTRDVQLDSLCLTDGQLASPPGTSLDRGQLHLPFDRSYPSDPSFDPLGNVQVGDTGAYTLPAVRLFGQAGSGAGAVRYAQATPGVLAGTVATVSYNGAVCGRTVLDGQGDFHFDVDGQNDCLPPFDGDLGHSYGDWTVSINGQPVGSRCGNFPTGEPTDGGDYSEYDQPVPIPLFLPPTVPRPAPAQPPPTRVPIAMAGDKIRSVDSTPPDYDLPPDTARVGDELSISARFIYNYVGTPPAHFTPTFTGTIDWQDGTVTRVPASAVCDCRQPPAVTIGSEHNYRQPGQWTITVTLTADDDPLAIPAVVSLPVTIQAGR